MTDEPTPETGDVAGDEKKPTTADKKPDEQDGSDPRIPELRREAAGYRHKLRETEGERDALAEQVTAMRRAEVERLAGDRLADSGDLWRSGVEVDQLLSDEGAPDPEKVGAVVEQLVKDRPHYRKQASPDFDGGARESAVSSTPDFGKALREASGR